MDEKFAKFLLEKTKKDYDKIAKEFDRTRSFIPEDIKKLANLAKEGERILDLGCGNGRLFLTLKEKRVDYFGIDFSKELIEIAKKRYPQGKFFVGDCLNLPFQDNFFDKVYSISVLHHIPSKEFRQKFLLEAKRVLKKDGLLILRVWDFFKRKGGPKLIFKFFLLKILGKTKLDFFDVFDPWKDSQGNVLAEIYFHCFSKRELEKLAKLASFETVEAWREGKGIAANLYLIAKK